MTLPGSSWDKPGAAHDPREAMRSLMDTAYQPPGAVGAWVGDRVRLVEVITAWGCSHGPDRPQGFLPLQVLKEAYFLFYGGSPHRLPAQDF